MSKQQKSVVIGGGIVGVCCALSLQKEGHQVWLIDPEPPGESTAKWSCGQMAVSEIIPLSKPGILKNIPRWLLDRTGPLALRPAAVPAILPWFLRFIANARQSRIEAISHAMATLTRDVYADFSTLLALCPDKGLLGQRPVIEVFDSPQGLAAERKHQYLLERLGFQAEIIDAGAIAELEPVLAGKFSAGVLFPDWCAVSDTKGFITALTEAFIRQGGLRVDIEAVNILDAQGRAYGVRLCDGRSLSADHVVVAAGMGSRRFYSQLGVRVPLTGISGYQVLLPEPEVEFRHSVIYADGGFCFTQMRRGLQIGGTIEFAGPDAKPDFRRAEIILQRACKILPQLNVVGKELGVGHRPFLPDTKPIIDRSRRLPNVLMAFGHGQLGLTLGATTGRLIADLAEKRPTKQDLKPFSAYRFMEGDLT